LSAPDYYRLLEVDQAASAEVLEAAYRRLARKYHPDLNPDLAAGQRMRELNEAYAVLKDPLRRAAYDRERRADQPRRAPRASGRARGAVAYVRRGAPPVPRVRRTERPTAPVQMVQSVRVPWPRLADALRRNRVLALAVVSALLLALGIAALAADLFVPADLAPAPDAPATAVVVVSQQKTPAPTPAFTPRATPTAAQWPPFSSDGVSAVPSGNQDAGGPSPESVRDFLSRAAQTLQRSVLRPPRGPVPPATPVSPS